MTCKDSMLDHFNPYCTVIVKFHLVKNRNRWCFFMMLNLIIPNTRTYELVELVGLKIQQF